jgi:hypothetical protein
MTVGCANSLPFPFSIVAASSEQRGAVATVGAPMLTGEQRRCSIALQHNSATRPTSRQAENSTAFLAAAFRQLLLSTAQDKLSDRRNLELPVEKNAKNRGTRLLP